VERVEWYADALKPSCRRGYVQRIAVAFDESPGVFHALTSAISLAKKLGAELQTVTVVAPPAYAGYVITLPVLSRVLSDDRVKFYEQLEEQLRWRADDMTLRFVTPSLPPMKLKPLSSSYVRRRWIC
jgi:hypothetical protein